MLQIVIYKKLNFWEEYTPLASRKATGPVSALATLELKSRIQPATSSGNLGIGEGGVPSVNKG